MITSGICSFSSNHPKLKLRRNTPYKVIFETPQGDSIVFNTPRHLNSQTKFECDEKLSRGDKRRLRENRWLGIGIGEAKQRQMTEKGHLRFNRPTPTSNADAMLMDNDSFYLVSKNSDWMHAILKVAPRAILEKLKLPPQFFKAISILDQIPSPKNGAGFYPHYRTQININKAKLNSKINPQSLMEAKVCSDDIDNRVKSALREIIEETFQGWEKQSGSRMGQIIFTVSSKKEGQRLKRKARLSKVLQPEQGSAAKFTRRLKVEIDQKLPKRLSQDIQAITNILAT